MALDLPGIFSTTIPEFIETLIGVAIPALIKSAPRIFESLIIGIARLLDPRGKFQKVGQALTPKFLQKKSKGGDPGGGLVSVGGNFDSSSGVSVGVGAGFTSFATGLAEATRDQLAMIHKGELIVPPDGTTSGRGQERLRGAGGGGVTVNINGGMIDRATIRDLIRQINIALGQQNLNLNGLA